MKHQPAEWLESFCCFLRLLYFISFAQQSTRQVTKHYDSATVQCAGVQWDNLFLNLFTAAKTLFWELPYQPRIHFVPGSVPFEESDEHPCMQEMFFSYGVKQRILGRTSCLQECPALVESLVCKHFPTFLILCSLQETFSDDHIKMPPVLPLVAFIPFSSFVLFHCTSLV